MPRSKFASPLFVIALLTVNGCMLTDIKTDSVTCHEGDTKCSGGNIYTCDANGNWGEKPTTECDTLGCSEGTIQPASSPLNCYDCGSDESKCEGDKLKTCVNHTWVENTCEYGCNADQCNECKPNETKCEDGYIYTCADGKWDETSKNKCEFGCINGLRADDGSVSCNECQENDMSCSDKGIKKCMGNSWRDIETCEFGCAKADANNYQCNDCNKDDYSNNPQNFCVKKVCINHKYEKEETFKVSCNEERTGKGECLNGSVQCVDSGNGEGIYQFCLDGTWNSFGKCDLENECSILEGKTCAEFSSVGYTCNEQKLKACPNNASCKSDGSGCATCTNGATKCNGKNMLACKSGEYQITSCGTGKHCADTNGKAECIAHECENGQQKCENIDIYECQNYQWKLKSTCNSNGYQCYMKDNKANCGCGKINNFNLCENYETCQNGICQRNSCTEDSSICPESTKCKTRECYNQGENYPLICDDSRVMDMWLNHYDVVDKILHHGELTDCEIYALVQEVIKADGTKLCNQISYCGNPRSLEKCIIVLITNISLGGGIPDGYDNIDGSTLSATIEFLSKDHSSCQNSCLDDPSICSKYQQCNSKGECVRKPCSLDKEICGEKYQCINDVCVRNTCDIDPSICGNLYCNTKTKECYKEDCGDDGEDCTKKIAFCSNKAVTDLFYENFAYLDAIARGDEQCEAFEELSFIFNTEGNAICESIPYCSLGSETSWFTCLADYVVDVYLGKQPAPEKYKDAVSMSLANTITNYKLGAICK